MLCAYTQTLTRYGPASWKPNIFYTPRCLTTPRKRMGLTFGPPLGMGLSCFVRAWAGLWGMARIFEFGKILGFPMAPFEAILKVRSNDLQKIARLAPCELITHGPLNLSPSLSLLSSNSSFWAFLWPKSLASQIPFSGPTIMGFARLNLLQNSSIINSKCPGID